MKTNIFATLAIVSTSLIMPLPTFANAPVYLNESGLNQYIVVLKDDLKVDGKKWKKKNFDEKERESKAYSKRFGVNHKRTFKKALSGFLIEGDEIAINELASQNEIKYIVQDSIVSINDTQSQVTWGLDRIDERANNLDGTYTYDRTGLGVNVYVVDTGINSSHNEFSGRASEGFDAVSTTDGETDCHGHGTHVAGIIGSNTYGVAKDVNLISVRVLGCSGSATTSTVIEGIDWITENGQGPAIVNMSLGGIANQAYEDAIETSMDSGFFYVVAAGNETTDACTRSPANVSAALTVGAIDSSDVRASFSNYGECVDVFAPGVDIESTYNTSNSATTVLDGTSMASPFVAGIAALYLEGNASASTDSIVNHVMGKTTYGLVTDRRTAATPSLIGYSKATNSNIKPLFRYHNSVTKDSHYNTLWAGLGSGDSANWVFKGVEGFVYTTNVSGSNPLYRYHNSTSGDHFFTSNWTELGDASGTNWKYEGIAGYLPSQSSETTNLYRYYSSSEGDHLYTITNLGTSYNTYTYEGVVGQVFAGHQD